MTLDYDTNGEAMIRDVLAVFKDKPIDLTLCTLITMSGVLSKECGMEYEVFIGLCIKAYLGNK